MAGIYVHIPYCRKACHYCNFHFSTNLANISELVSAITTEISHRRDELEGAHIDTVYYGGGTPSILDLPLIKLIHDAINASFELSDVSEITLEANPEDISKDKLDGWWGLGINRLSIGIQSFFQDDLTFMNRAHNAEQSHTALSLIGQSRFTNCTADLMFGLIHGNQVKWEENLKMMMEYDIPHLSLYNLTIEEQTVFANWTAKQKISEMPESIQEHQFHFASQFLQDHGYDHYEISNYAKGGFHSIHNTNYWKRVPYLGIGPAAHSYVKDHRSWNVANNAQYIKAALDQNFTASSEALDQSDVYNEMVMLGLRTKRGIELDLIKELPSNFYNFFQERSKPYLEKNWMIETNEALKISTDKWFLSDQIASELFYIKSDN